MTLSDEDRNANQLTDENLAVALSTLKERGFVVLESVIPKSCIERTRQLFHEETLRQFAEMSEEDAPETVDVEAARVIFTAWPGCPVQYVHRDSR